MREIVLDTETTGLDPHSGHRIVEIGCVELINHVATGRHFQKHVNPEREMPKEAQAIHGLTEDFLSNQPVFADVADEFMEFIAGATLVIHNAAFDLGFINAELERLDRTPLAGENVIDTVSLARRKFPGAQASLDALCRRFQIDNSDRSLHGALKDARLLAEVYLELVGGRQQNLGLASGTRADGDSKTLDRRAPRPHGPTAEEDLAHVRFLEKLEAPVWKT